MSVTETKTNPPSDELKFEHIIERFSANISAFEFTETINNMTIKKRVELNGLNGAG